MAFYRILKDLLGVRIPDEAGFVSLHAPGQEMVKSIAHFDEELEARFSAAIRILDAELRANQKGIPSVRQRILLKMKWVPGPSL